MSESSALWLRISPESTRFYTIFLAGAHLLALVGSLVAGLPTPVRLGLVLAIGFSFFFHLRRLRLDRTEHRPLIVYGEREGWSFQIGTGPPVRTELLASSVVTRWITILHFKAPQTRVQSFVILPDSLDAESYRRLRMVLTISEKK